MTQTASATHEVGRKFHADGSARQFAGNTIICFVAPESAIGQAASTFQAALRAQPFGAKFALLPPSSFHMTVMELLCDQIRVRERWSAQLDLDLPLAESDSFFAQRVPGIPAPTGLIMHVSGLYYANNLMLTLQPAESATAAALRTYRESIAAVTGVRFLDHAEYGFHMSLGYRLDQLDATEAAALTDVCATWTPQLQAAGTAIALPPPELTAFDDMTLFVPMHERHTLNSRGG